MTEVKKVLLSTYTAGELTWSLESGEYTKISLECDEDWMYITLNDSRGWEYTVGWDLDMVERWEVSTGPRMVDLAAVPSDVAFVDIWQNLKDDEDYGDLM